MLDTLHGAGVEQVRLTMTQGAPETVYATRARAQLIASQVLVVGDGERYRGSVVRSRRALPRTTTARGSPGSVWRTNGMKSRCAVHLDHVQTVPATALGRRVSALTADKPSRVCGALAFALACTTKT